MWNFTQEKKKNQNCGKKEREIWKKSEPLWIDCKQKGQKKNAEIYILWTIIIGDKQYRDRALCMSAAHTIRKYHFLFTNSWLTNYSIISWFIVWWLSVDCELTTFEMSSAVSYLDFLCGKPLHIIWSRRWSLLRQWPTQPNAYLIE